MPAASPGFTLAGMLRAIASRTPDAPAVTMDGATSSYADLHRRSSQVANLLRERGVRSGDRVAILDKNAPGFFDVLLGAAKLGAVLVGLNHRLAPAELATIVDDAAPVLTFTRPDLRGLLPAGTPVLELGPGFEQRRDAADGTDPDVRVDPDDVALQLYSSGTTGQPKGAMLTHANLSWTPRMGREFYAMDAGTVNLVPSPLFHIGGVGYALSAMGQGGHTVLVREVEPGLLLRLIEAHRVTHSFMVPSVVRLLVEHPALAGTDLSSLRRIAYGGAPMGSALLHDAMRRLGCGFMAVYGMTETAGTVVSMAPEQHDPDGPGAARLRSIGQPLPWVEIRIVDPLGAAAGPADPLDPADAACPADPAQRAVGEVGEIWVRSPQDMAGYWARPDLTAATLVGGGWLRTGDAAYRDADGFVFLHDRIKDMIVSGGENIYPAEVEQVLAGHPAVAELAVIGVPSARWGETVKAVVVPRPGTTPDPDELIAWTRDRLAHYKCPTSVDVVAQLPRNATGKVLKHRLREPYRQPAP